MLKFTFFTLFNDSRFLLLNLGYFRLLIPVASNREHNFYPKFFRLDLKMLSCSEFMSMENELLIGY